jgi:ribonuclease P protein component
VVVRLDSDRSACALGFSVSRSVGGAVVRNRLRRQIREIMREFDLERPLPGGDYLVIVTPSANGLDSATLRGHLQRVRSRVESR